jgi:hypothetical protein
VSWLLVRWSPQSTASGLWWVGVALLLVTVAFEVVLGRFVSGLSWSALLADYDISRGRLWPLVLVGVLVGPRFWSGRSGRSRP